MTVVLSTALMRTSPALLRPARGGETLEAVKRRTVYFLSDQTGVTAETVGHSVLAQFAGLEVHEVTLPFVSSVDKAHEAVRRINRTAEVEGVRPIVFSTLVEDELRGIVMKCNALFLDCFAGLVDPLERELERRSAHRATRSHPVADAAYTLRMDAINYALMNDDGGGGDYGRADIVFVGVSRSGKTPTCIYMALQYGVFAANYPLTDDDLESGTLPQRLVAHRSKLYALTIRPERLKQIREERRPQSRYASTQQIEYEIRSAEAMFTRYGIAVLDTTDSSIEEIASRILNDAGIERRLRP
jgi:regulator of PEP synthase PpsR (kinase-PPPase family)